MPTIYFQFVVAIPLHIVCSHYIIVQILWEQNQIHIVPLVKSIISAEMTRRCVYAYTLHIHPRQVVIMSNRHVLVICLTIIWDLILFLIRISHVHLTHHILLFRLNSHDLIVVLFFHSWKRFITKCLRIANWVKAKFFFSLMFFFLVFKYYYFSPFKSEINWFFFISTNSMMNQDFEENSNALYIHYR